MKQKLRQATQALQQLFTNTKRLLHLAWETDATTAFLYYLTAALGAVMPVIASYLLKIVIDQLGLAQDQSVVATIPLIIIFVLAAKYLAGLLEDLIYHVFNQTYLDYIFRYQLQNQITLKFHQKIQELDIAHFEDPDTQDLITKTRDTMQWRLPDFLRIFSYLFRDTVTYLSAFAVLFSFAWWVPLLVTVITLPRLWLKAKYGAVQWSIWGSGAPQVRKLWYFNHLLQDPVTVKEIRIGRSAQALLERFRQLQEYLLDLNRKPLQQYLRVSIVPPFLEMVVVLGIIYLFIPQVLAGVMTIGSFTLLVSMLEQLNRRAANAATKFAELYEDNLYLQHYFQLLSLPKLVQEAEEPVVFSDIEPPTIEFRHVSFTYPDGPEVLKDINFQVGPGQSLALVGHNGAGKSTIIKLLCRFYDVTEGEILINGVSLKQLKLEHWYQFLGTLFQEFVQYHFTVEQNIALGDQQVDQQAMQRAAQEAGAADFIQDLPNQYQQLLGRQFAEGVELSIGQWQKLAIARAFYQQPPVLILDEPTSAVDAEAEFQIFNNLEEQYQDKILIMVSHRFSTVRNADKILVVSEGQIIERGSHQQLLDKNGQYARLFQLQAQGYQ
jgi:ATP-binding cassette subfamily B protein